MKKLFSILLLMVLVSCATTYQPYARDVKKKPGVEGVIALKREFRTEDRALAETMMGQNCSGKKINIIEEGEVQVGTTTSTNAQARDEKEDNGINLAGFKLLTGGQTDVTNTNTTSNTMAVKEWQINYNCISNMAEETTTKTKKEKKL